MSPATAQDQGGRVGSEHLDGCGHGGSLIDEDARCRPSDSPTIIPCKPDISSGLWARQRKCRYGPGGGRHRDELVFAVWKSALEVRLEWLAPRRDEPGAVWTLRGNQELEPLAVDGIIGRQAARLMQGHEGRPGSRWSDTDSAFDLRPSAILSTSREQLLGGFRDRFLGCVCCFSERTVGRPGPRCRRPRRFRATLLLWKSSRRWRLSGRPYQTWPGLGSRGRLT